MIVARKLETKSSLEASQLDWKSMTHNFSEIMIDVYIDMQTNKHDKLSVCDLILNALRHDRQKHLFEEEIESKLRMIRKMIEQGTYSPYREIERLTRELEEKDAQIIELLTQLDQAHDEGDEVRTEDFLTKIVHHSIRLGHDTAEKVDHVLLKLDGLKAKHPQQFKLLDEFLAHPELQSKSLEAIERLSAKFDKAINKPTAVYQSGAVHNDYSHRISITGEDQQKQLPDV